MRVASPPTTPAAQPANNLEALFRPRGIAILGASPDPTKLGHQVLQNLLEAGYPGPLAVIHPTAGAILGVPTYTDLAAVPSQVSLLILAVPATATPAVIAAIERRQAVRGDLEVVVAIAGGFAETQTEAGALYQEQLAAACRAANLRLVGPNCIGVIDNRNRIDTTFLSGILRKPSGIALVSQSGSMGAWIAQEWANMPVPVGLNKFISLGNMAGVEMGEMIDYLGRDTTTRAIGLYLEGSPSADALLTAAGRVAMRKPVVVLKVGRTEPGSRAARLHTGALAGTDEVYAAAFRQFGLIRTPRVDTFATTLSAFDRLPLPLGERVAVLTNAGGPGVYAVDGLADLGLTPARLSPATLTILRGILPPFATMNEPDGYVDMTGGVGPHQVAQAVAAVLRDPGVDAVLHLFVPTRFNSGEAMAEELLALLPGVKRNSLEKPLFPVLLAHQSVAQARRRLEENGIITFGSPDQAIAALAALVRFATAHHHRPGR